MLTERKFRRKTEISMVVGSRASWVSLSIGSFSFQDLPSLELLDSLQTSSAQRVNGPLRLTMLTLKRLIEGRMKGGPGTWGW